MFVLIYVCVHFYIFRYTCSFSNDHILHLALKTNDCFCLPHPSEGVIKEVRDCYFILGPQEILAQCAALGCHSMYLVNIILVKKKIKKRESDK